MKRGGLSVRLRDGRRFSSLGFAIAYLVAIFLLSFEVSLFSFTPLYSLGRNPPAIHGFAYGELSWSPLF